MMNVDAHYGQCFDHPLLNEGKRSGTVREMYKRMTDLSNGDCALKCVPATRRAAGKRAHLKVYHKLAKMRTFDEINTFLCLKHPSPHDVQNHQLFFEVNLGFRIADSVVLAPHPTTPICYIVEVKTCLTDDTDMFSDLRQAQRLQGLCQLADAARVIQQEVPRGALLWHIIPILIFKSQRALKTIHSETANIGQVTVASTATRLACFMHSREDAGTRRIIHTKRRRTMAPTTSSILVNPTPKQCAIHRRRRGGRGAAAGMDISHTFDTAMLCNNSQKSHREGARQNGARTCGTCG
uniref:Nuclear protein n=1 Tax=Otarine gammaherpesvirus 4 TaxID=2801541 RepID=A0A889IWJ3_9GAMA|nr:Nuclear protein [Otarine gammaherpesvirus 4]